MVDNNLGRKSDANPPTFGINLYKSGGHSPEKGFINSQSFMNKSPLKPSNDSLLEHYKYEKQSKQGGGIASQPPGPGSVGGSLLSQHSSAKKQHLSASKNSTPAVVEEPKIISMTTSGFN